MPTPMKRRDVIQRLVAIGANIIREGGDHTIYGCACGLPQTAVPRHREITAGVVGSIQRKIECEPKGWLQ